MSRLNFLQSAPRAYPAQASIIGSLLPGVTPPKEIPLAQAEEDLPGADGVTLHVGRSPGDNVLAPISTWVSTDSTLVQRMRWEPYTTAARSGALYVTFKKSGVTCKYEYISKELWASFVNAPSKGKWCHTNIWHLPYLEV